MLVLRPLTESQKFRDDPAHRERVEARYAARVSSEPGGLPGRSGVTPVRLAIPGAIRAAVRPAGFRGVSALARHIRRNETVVYRIVHRRAGASLNMANAIAEALGLAIEELFEEPVYLTDEQRAGMHWSVYPQVQPQHRPAPDFDPTQTRSFIERVRRTRAPRWSRLDAMRLHLMSDEVLFARIAAVMVRNGVPA